MGKRTQKYIKNRKLAEDKKITRLVSIEVLNNQFFNDDLTPFDSSNEKSTSNVEITNPVFGYKIDYTYLSQEY